MQQTWGAPIANGYAMSEGVFSGFCGHGIHLPDDLIIFEPVDVNGHPVGADELSHRVLITNLYNHVQPLIRYEVTDQITLASGTCPCGSSMQRIEDPQGRLDDIFVYDDGLSVHPHLFRSALGHHREILEYQVRQTPQRRHHRPRHRRTRGRPRRSGRGLPPGSPLWVSPSLELTSKRCTSSHDRRAAN